ncbi:MAG: ornithine carbamoyltransferase [Candidatus Omnitrophica bacterium]|nr:ornithine carbamoyltransferase [Candidatus Omnitrophota bacterium]
MKKDLISINDLTREEIGKIFKLTDEIKFNKKKFEKTLSGKTLGLLFQKPSNRTRVSFEVGMAQLGGHSIYLGPEDIKLGEREAVKDVAKVLSKYLDGIVARTFSHNDIIELAEFSSVPVINGLSDLMHPCQALSDVYTIREKSSKFKSIKLAYVGDGNNVLNSLIEIAGKMGLYISAATPKGYEPDKEILNAANKNAKLSSAKIELLNDPYKAAEGADFIYTDVWTSMGKEHERKIRLEAFKGFQVNTNLISRCKKDCLVMHCLPAHRQEEITNEILDSPNSIVFEQAENRLYVQKAILIMLLLKE